MDMRAPARDTVTTAAASRSARRAQAGAIWLSQRDIDGLLLCGERRHRFLERRRTFRPQQSAERPRLLVVNRVRRLTDPIRRLAEAANRIAGGQRSVTVAIDSKDELIRFQSR